MESRPEDIDVLRVMERVLSAALREVRAARARVPVPDAVKRETSSIVRTSQTGYCVDILAAAGRPLHVGALLAALEARGVRTTRESLVSAISKKLNPLGPFVRTAPNTFGLASRETREV